MAATETPTRPPAPDAPDQGKPTPEQDEEEERRPEQPEEEQPEEEAEEEGEPKPARRRQQEKPPDLNDLLEKADPETLRKNRRLMSIAGRMAEAQAAKRAEEIVKQRMEEYQAESTRQALLKRARAGDYQTLGEQHAQTLIQQDQERYLQNYQGRARQEAYAAVQTTLDEIVGGFDDAVVAAAAEKVGDLSDVTEWTAGFKRWLPALVQAQAEHLARAPEQRKRVENDVTPAVKARVLAEMNGSEPVADSGTGRAPKQRVVTDEEIAQMSIDEWKAIYDVAAGKFKPGVTHRPTNSINPSQSTNGRVMSSSR